MKNKKVVTKFFKFLMIGILFLVLVCTITPITAKANELFFDKDGNLYFYTRDRKYSGSVGYKTLGWVIKRYDMPMDAIGQQYVIVKKEIYKPMEDDPSDDRYVLSYFKSDRNEILNAVKEVSEEWYNLLSSYGEDVYIDSVMTVCSQTEDCGTLYKNGSYEGEVYFTYDGIVNARGWTKSSVELLKSHYDMMLRFPQQVEDWDPYVEIISTEYVDVNTSRYASFSMGAGSYGYEKFDILKGIPSGETLYIKGKVDGSQGVLHLRKVKARLVECVEVPVTYKMKWVDYYGNHKEELREILRYYAVKRVFTYYEYVGFDEYMLSHISVAGQILEGQQELECPKAEKMDVQVVAYGSYEEHIVNYEKLLNPDIGTVLLIGDNGKKPAIPDTDYSSIADEQLSDVIVKNDKITIDGQLVLSDEPCVKNGDEPLSLFLASNVDVYGEEIKIANETYNGMYSDTKITLVYEDSDNRRYIHQCGEVMVHTPVICDANASTDKRLNQAVKPTSKDVVLGEEFTISFNDFGTHKNILGYGIGSYTKYVGLRQVRCPFDVEYEGKIYSANTWIDVWNYTAKFSVLENSTEGDYNIEIRTLAYNSAGEISEAYLEKKANTNSEKYGAYNSIPVRIIGKLHKLELSNNGESYVADKLPYQIVSLSDSFYKLGFEIVGDMEVNDSVKISYAYYYEDVNGELMPVDVYGVKDRNYIDEFLAGKFVDEQVLYIDKCEKKENVSLWNIENPLYGELVVVKKGTSVEDIQEAIKRGKTEDIMLKQGFVIVSVDITSYKENVPYLSYINEINAVKGYCNKWTAEGGTDAYPYGTVLKIALGNHTYYEYEISGTH